MRLAILLAMLLVACSGPSLEINDLPPLGIVMFDGWPNPSDLPGGTSNSHVDPRQSGTFQADWTSREPTQGFANYGTGVNVQARADVNINAMADHGVDFIAPLIIIPSEIYGATVDADPIRQDMAQPFNAYLASAYKSRLKFVPLLQSYSLRYPYPGFPGHFANNTDGGAYLSQWGTYVAGLLNDPQCMTIGGKKVVGIYNTPEWPSAMHATFVAAVTAAGGPAFSVIDWSHSPSDAVRLGAIATVNYTPNPGLPAGNGQHSYQEQVTVATALATPAGTGYGAVIDYRADLRPLSHSGSDAITPWVDEPGLPEHFSHAYSMLRRVVSTFRPTIVVGHAWNEYAEGGQGYEPSKQGGTRALDVLRWAKDQGTRPTTYTYSLSPEGSLFGKVGTWTMTRLLATTAYDNRAMTSSTLNDTLSFTHIVTTAFALYGDTALAGGTFNVQVDGGTATPVSTVGSAAHHQLLWSSGALAEGTHTVLVTILGTGSVSLDALKITCNPSNFPAP